MFDVSHLVQASGLLIVAIIVFVESGVVIGFLVPNSDTLLLSAGVLAASGKLPIIPTIMVAAVAAILGDNSGYHFGRQFGRRLFSKPDSLFFRHEYVMRAETFYEKYGSKTMLLAHFVPIVRTFAPLTAGAGKMSIPKYMGFDAIGDICWAIIVTSLGYFLGKRIPGLSHYIDLVFVLIILVILTLIIYHNLKDPRIRVAIKRFLKF